MKVKNQYLKIVEYLHLSFNKWPSYSINCGYLLFFETTIMGNTADLAMVQKTGWLFKECCIKAYSIQNWLEGRNWVGKCAQATGMTASLRILSSKAYSNTWESFARSELKLESVHQEPPHLDIFRKGPSHFWTRNNIRSILPGLRRKRTGLLLRGPKSSFQMKVHFAFHLEIKVWRKSEEAQNPCCLKSSVKFPVSDDLGCHVICWCWSTVFSEVHSQRNHLPEHFRAIHASFCWQALWRCWFHFPAGLGIWPHCQRYQKLVQWPWCYCAWLTSKLAWPEPHREWSITPEQCHRLIASMPRSIDAVIHAKGGPTKYWVHRN